MLISCSSKRITLEKPFRLLLISCALKKYNEIEGFSGKRALGFLLKSELCQKCSKCCMQFCLGVLNNVLHVFAL